MDINIVLFGFALLLCRVRAQYCGCSDPLIYPTILPTTSPSPQIISAPQVLPTPAIGTTIIDNYLSTALANVLQLLIVSDLIESTLNTALGLRSAPVVNPVCEPVYPKPIVYTPSVELTSPVVNFIPPCTPVLDIIPEGGPVIDYIKPCGQVYDFVPQCGSVVDFISPCGQVYDFVPQCGSVIDFIPPCGQMIDYVPPIIDYSPTCSPLYDYTPTCGQYIEPLPNFHGEFLPPLPNLATFPATTSNYCSGRIEYVSPVANNVPVYTQTLKPNLMGALQEIGPIQMAPAVPNGYNGLAEFVRPIGSMGPLAELLLPSAIPAQLTCNIGTIPASLPCVSVNVEPLPCGCGYGSNPIGSSYFY